MARPVKSRNLRAFWILLPAALMLFLLVLPILEIVRVVLASEEKFSELIIHFTTTPLYRKVLLNTIYIALLVTGGALVVGYPIAFVVAHSSRRLEKVLLGVMVASMGMSVLIRTYAWTVLLETGGLFSILCYKLGLTSEPASLLFTRTAVVVAMTHVLCPYMVFAIWSNTAAQARSMLPVAESFGATKFLYLLRIYMPQSVRGVLAGSALVFLFSLGFLITPELLGGGGGNTMMIAVLINEQVNELGNWAQGAIISLMLLVLIGILLSILWKLLPSLQARLFGNN
jgi:ABC-type spermidine/putrescine transport system permease subunit I